MELFDEILGWQDEEEVDDGGEDEEVDDGGEELSVFDGSVWTAGSMKDEIVEVRLSDKGAEQRTNDIGGQCGDDRCEGSSNDDGDGEVHYVATQNEVAESLEHE
jgi:hypothetical protein